MSPAIRKTICYVPGVAAIICGIGLGLLQMAMLPMMKMVICDSMTFATGEGLERVGQLGPWRPATAADLQFRPEQDKLLGEPNIDPPVDRYIVREATANAYLHHIRLMIVRSKSGEPRLDKVIHLNAQWRVGWAILVVSLTTLGPMVLGWAWIRLMRRLLNIRQEPVTYSGASGGSAITDLHDNRTNQNREVLE